MSYNHHTIFQRGQILSCLSDYPGAKNVPLHKHDLSGHRLPNPCPQVSYTLNHIRSCHEHLAQIQQIRLESSIGSRALKTRQNRVSPGCEVPHGYSRLMVVVQRNLNTLKAGIAWLECKYHQMIQTRHLLRLKEVPLEHPRCVH